VVRKRPDLEEAYGVLSVFDSAVPMCCRSGSPLAGANWTTNATLPSAF